LYPTQVRTEEAIALTEAFPGGKKIGPGGWGGKRGKVKRSKYFQATLKRDKRRGKT